MKRVSAAAQTKSRITKAKRKKMLITSTLLSKFKRKSREDHVRTFLLEKNHRTTVIRLNTLERK